MVACTSLSWQARRSAMESPSPRVMAISCAVGFLEISGKRIRSPARPGRSFANTTSTSESPATDRTQPAIAWRSGSVSIAVPGFALELSPRPAIVFPVDSRRPRAAHRRCAALRRLHVIGDVSRKTGKIRRSKRCSQRFPSVQRRMRADTVPQPACARVRRTC